jgi:hypothetical protein
MLTVKRTAAANKNSTTTLLCGHTCHCNMLLSVRRAVKKYKDSVESDHDTKLHCRARCSEREDEKNRVIKPCALNRDCRIGANRNSTVGPSDISGSAHLCSLVHTRRLPAGP